MVLAKREEGREEWCSHPLILVLACSLAHAMTLDSSLILTLISTDTAVPCRERDRRGERKTETERQRESERQ